MSGVGNKLRIYKSRYNFVSCEEVQGYGEVKADGDVSDDRGGENGRADGYRWPSDEISSFKSKS